MIYSGKEDQTTSNGHNSWSTLVPTVSPSTFTAPPLVSQVSMTSSSGESTPPEELESIHPPPNVYYNARLDPKNFLEGPISVKPATRLRQMLARPGIVVSVIFLHKCWAQR